MSSTWWDPASLLGAEQPRAIPYRSGCLRYHLVCLVPPVSSALLLLSPTSPKRTKATRPCVLIGNLFTPIYIFSWGVYYRHFDKTTLTHLSFLSDTLLVIETIITPKKLANRVISEGHPGNGGKWLEYIAPKEDDSRWSCPGVNAMVNHGENHGL